MENEEIVYHEFCQEAVKMVEFFLSADWWYDVRLNGTRVFFSITAGQPKESGVDGVS